MRKKTGQKVKLFFRFCILLLIAAIGLSSCKNLFEQEIYPRNESPQETSAGAVNQNGSQNSIGSIRISLEQPGTQDSRTVQPIIDYLNITSITLTGTHNGETRQLGQWNSVTELTADSLDLDIGAWSLTLDVIKDSFTFSDSKSVNVVFMQTQSVAFSLSSNTNKGGTYIKLNFTGNAVNAAYRLTQFPSGTLIDSGTLNVTTSAGGNYVLYQRSGSSNLLNSRTYRLELIFYGDTGQSVVLNNYSELIRIKGGFISRAERNIDLNQLYTITYDLDGGQPEGGANLIEKYSVRSSVITLPALEKSGYIFEGWYNSSNTKITTIYPSQAANVNLHALFTIELKEGPAINSEISNWPSATRIVASGTAPPDGTSGIHYLDTIDTNVPVWWDSAEGCVKFFADGYTNGSRKLKMRPDSSQMFKDCGTLKILDLSPFDTSVVTDMSQMFYGDSLLETVYVSSAFNTASVTASTNMFYDCEKLRGENGTFYTNDKPKTKEYAAIDVADGAAGYFWSAPTSDIYTITYVLDGGTNNSSNVPSYHAGKLPFTLQSPTKAGYDFAGWFIDSGFSGSAVNNIPEGSTGHKTYYAKWTGSSGIGYTVKHWQQHINDDSYDEVEGDRQALSGVTDQQTAAVANSYTGFDAQTITQQTISASGNTVVNVYYNRKTINLTINLDGGNIDGSTTAVTRSGRYGANVSSIGIVAKTGYTFANWLDGSGSTSYTLPLTFPATNNTYTAQWTVNQYSVTYMAEDADSSDTSISLPSVSLHDYNSPVAINFTASRTAYDFAGWKRGSTTYTSTGTSSFTMPAENVILYAQWTPIDYTITYELGSGTNNSSNPATYNIEQSVTFADPTRSDGDYSFAGWYQDLEDEDSKVEGIAAGNYGSITIYAKWLPLYAKVNGAKKYTKADTLTAISDASGAITIELQSVVPAADLGVYNTEDTIAYTIAQKTNDEATTGINFSAVAGANGEKIALTNCKELFKNCKKLTSVNMTNFDTSAAEDMTYMFYSCENLATLTLTDFSTAAATNMASMFGYCKALTSLNLSSFNTANVADMNSMFTYCESLSTITFGINFNTRNVTRMNGMFSYCKALTALDLSFFDTAKVTLMNQMFSNCITLASLNISSFNTSNVIWMSSMFSKCKALASLDVSNFDTSKVNDFQCMFETCENLESLDVSNFNTAKGEKMDGMFSYCSKITSLDLSNFNTAKVTTMQSMFNECTSLSSVNLTSFDTRRVQYMTYMFDNCTALTSLNLSSFKTSNLAHFASMFYNCSSLTTITVSPDFTLPSYASLSDKSYIFKGCTSLVGGWAVDAEKTVYTETPYAGVGSDDSAYARIDGGPSAPGYFTCCIGTKGKPYAVGDIVFKDGSAMPYETYAAYNATEQAAVKPYAIALIFYVGTELNSGTDTTTSRTLGMGLITGSGCFYSTSEEVEYHRNITPIQCTPSTMDCSTATFNDPDANDRNGSDNLEQIAEFAASLNMTPHPDTTSTGFYFAKHYKDAYVPTDELGPRVSGTPYENGWYFPTIAEVAKIYVNGKGSSKLFDIETACQSLDGNHGWATVMTSSQVADDYQRVWGCYFSTGEIEKHTKNSVYTVFAIREF